VRGIREVDKTVKREVLKDEMRDTLDEIQSLRYASRYTVF
jgi:hypothetical protein